MKSVQYTIAIVDDDLKLLESLGELMQSAGYVVRTFPSAALLLEGSLTQIDCLISDISMPVMDGLELKRIANERRPNLPVILMTGNEALSKEQFERAGHRHVFEKPFDPDVFLDTVSELLEP
jgi:FixJ family two-component response regulator